MNLKKIMKLRMMSKSSLLGVIVLFFAAACTNESPKPTAYFRIALEPKQYECSDSLHPYVFEYPSNISRIVYGNEHQDWFDIVYPRYNARIYCSYKPIDGNFREISEDSRNFVYKHVIKAEAISEKAFENAESNVYGILYDIKGNAASQVQFVVTDSVKHCLRGALYFNERPNKDSIAPVADYIREDIVRLMETVRWK